MEERLWFNLPSMVQTRSECKSFLVLVEIFVHFLVLLID